MNEPEKKKITFCSLRIFEIKIDKSRAYEYYLNQG